MIARWPALSLVFALTGTAAQAVDGLSVVGEIERSSGKYGGSTSTDILFVPIVARYETGPTIYKLTVPYVEISGPGNVQITNGMSIGQAATGPITPSTPNGKASGLGDIVGGISYNAYYDAISGLLVDVGGRVKFATASKDKGLGTGKNDFSVQTDVYWSLGRNSTVTATLGYTWMGKPVGSNFRDTVFGSLGVSHKINADMAISSFLDYRQAVVSGNVAPSELSLYLSRRVDKHWKLQAYALAGLSNASPAQGFGLILGYSM